jgi:type IV fimbrial biogenesis protein FimT
LSHTMNSQRRCAGLTLPELLIGLAIAVILLLIAVPSFNNVIRNNRLNSQMGSFVAMLNLTRSEAVTRGKWVRMCASSDGAACTGSPWQAGWIVFVDKNNDGTLDAGEELIRVAPSLLDGYSLQGSTNVAGTIAFRSTGVANATGSFVLCLNNQLNLSRAVFVNSAGRIFVSPDSNNNGIPENAAGTDLPRNACSSPP